MTKEAVMPQLHHQIVRLDRGQHVTPRMGMCVVELASVLAGDPFSDRPPSVCPVLAAFLRIYNDRIDDVRRQDLIAFAPRIAESVVTRRQRRMRADLCVATIRPLRGGRGRRLPGRSTMAAAWAARHAPLEEHERVLWLLDRLLAIGEPTTPAGAPTGAEAVEPALQAV
jgi:hypothetical protein